MAKGANRGAEPDLPSVLQGILADVERLIGQQVDLLRSEVRRELGEAKAAAVSAGAGVGLLAAGGLLSTLMAVHGLHRATGLPLWACYGLVGGGLGAAGAGLLAAGGRKAAGVQLAPPPETAGALRENLAWLREQAAAAP